MNYEESPLLPFLKDYIKNTKDDWNYITPKDFYENYFKSKTNYYLIDLRKKSEFKKFHIKRAKNIFWLDLLKPKNLSKLPKDKLIFLICYVGHTSSQAMVLLKLLGYKVVSIKFGYGIPPAQGVPISGWLQLNYPVVRCK